MQHGVHSLLYDSEEQTHNAHTQIAKARSLPTRLQGCQMTDKQHTQMVTNIVDVFIGNMPAHCHEQELVLGV